MAVLRAPGGCPWDQKQTHTTLRPFLLEESYEAIDAIDRRDFKDLPGELGDVLFQVVFHAEVAAGDHRFDITDVLEAISSKLIRRHPHVFTASGRKLSKAARARRQERTPGDVLEKWERLKAAEQAAAGEQRRVLSGVPRALPALLRAHKIGSRVASVGFDWPEARTVMDKIEEEVRELRAALDEGHDRMEDEMGDLFFAIANLARKLKIEPEAALARANDKFTRRFNAVEATLDARGSSVHDASLGEMEAIWATVKKAEAASAPSTGVPARRARSRPARPSRR